MLAVGVDEGDARVRGGHEEAGRRHDVGRRVGAVDGGVGVRHDLLDRAQLQVHADDAASRVREAPGARDAGHAFGEEGVDVGPGARPRRRDDPVPGSHPRVVHHRVVMVVHIARAAHRRRAARRHARRVRDVVIAPAGGVCALVAVRAGDGHIRGAVAGAVLRARVDVLPGAVPPPQQRVEVVVAGGLRSFVHALAVVADERAVYLEAGVDHVDLALVSEHTQGREHRLARRLGAAHEVVPVVRHARLDELGDRARHVPRIRHRLGQVVHEELEAQRLELIRSCRRHEQACEEQLHFVAGAGRAGSLLAPDGSLFPADLSRDSYCGRSHGCSLALMVRACHQSVFSVVQISVACKICNLLCSAPATRLPLMLSVTIVYAIRGVRWKEGLRNVKPVLSSVFLRFALSTAVAILKLPGQSRSDDDDAAGRVSL